MLYVLNMNTAAQPDTRTIGYARVSTEEQDLSLQINALRKAGCDHIIEEKASGKSMERDGLDRVRRCLRSGDTLKVWKLDRLGRSVKGLLNFIDWTKEEGIELEVLTEQIDTTTPSGRMVTTVMAALAQMERELTSERTRSGMDAKRAAGHVFGRRHSIKGSPRRLAAFKPYIDNGQAMDIQPDEALRILNEAAPKERKITSPETFRRWRRDGFPGIAAENELQAE